MREIKETKLIHESSEYIFKGKLSDAVQEMQRSGLVIDPINVSTSDRNLSVYFTVILVGRSKE